MALSGLPFDDIRALANNLPTPDEEAGTLARTRDGDLEILFGPNGRQAELSAWLASYSGKSPSVNRPMLALFAGTHKVREHVPDNHREATLATVTRLAAGGAPVNQVCAMHDIGLKVFDLALQIPVDDIASREALDEKASAATIGFGMEAIAGGVDLLGLGGFGQASEIANALIISRNIARDAEDVLACMPNVAEGEKAIARKVEMLHAQTSDPLELLRRVGGREHSALAGAILAARINHVPVVLEGWTALAVMLLLQHLEPGSCDHCVLASVPADPADAYAIAANRSGLLSVFSDFGIAGDGTTAAMAMGALKAVAAVHCNTVISTA